MFFTEYKKPSLPSLIRTKWLFSVVPPKFISMFYTNLVIVLTVQPPFPTIISKKDLKSEFSIYDI